MKVENMENWPADAVFPLWRAKFKLMTAEEPTVENLREWFKTGNNQKGNVALFANPKTMKALDVQIPTTDTTYRRYFVMNGIVNHIIEDFDGLTDDGAVYLLMV